MTYVIVWDNVRFHHAQMVQAWFQAHPQFTTLYLPPYSPFFNPIEDFFSTLRWKVGALKNKPPFSRPWMTHAMTSQQTSAMPGFARRFFPRFLANENIHCDVDENLNPQDRVDGNIEVQ
jgi:hypothetical protein